MQDTKYTPENIENKWYRFWENNNYFQPDFKRQTAFSVQLPPPNVTGTLHMGHAFNQTIMDALVRYHRMKGDNTCWIPGSDHAGIATQIVVERQLASQGTSRHDLGREAFLEKVWEWKQFSGSTMSSQIRRMGCSVDWSREYFTMDDTRAKAVTNVFVQLYEQGLIYRGKRLVNWDPILGTAVSDLEVENIEEAGKIWYIRYPLSTNPQESITIATTRPETLLGDVAVAVHPQDERYTHLIGKTLQLPLCNREIPIIADEYVDKEFGTGCVKITPAHDFNDYQVGQRHQTVLINVLDLEAKIRPEAEVFDFANVEQKTIRLPEKYIGKTVKEARQAIVQDLKEQGFLVEEKDHTLMIPRGDRTGSPIEPMLTNQWFVAMSATPDTTKYAEVPSEFAGMSLADKARYAVSSGQVKFVPENWVNTYNQWMNNIQDWCISRQLWWGHRIPAWYDDQGNVYVAHSIEEAQQLAGEHTLKQDEDVLDTWFSSALVPFSTLGWTPDGLETEEMKAFLPSNVLVTGYEIIFFWVARMIFMTTHFTGKVPFKEVYIHGMVRDNTGKKMSKSEGNVIDPVDLIDGIGLPELLKKRTTGLRRPEKATQVIKDTEKLFPDGIPVYGTDALRMTMASYASLGRSINFDFKRCEGYRNFCNKLWNATRFVLMNTENRDCGPDVTLPCNYSFVDLWICSCLQETIIAVTEAYNTYRFDLAAQYLYEFVWNEYCDWYVELTKIQLQNSNEAIQRATRQTLVQTLECILRLLHPIMPFITEELWQSIIPLVTTQHPQSIMEASFPVVDNAQINSASLSRMAELKDLINSIRNLRGEMNIPASTKVPLFIESTNDINELLSYLIMPARLSEVHLCDRLPENIDAPIAVCGTARMILEVKIDKKAETIRLNKELDKLQKQSDKLSVKLAKPGYVEKAPSHLVEKDKQELLLIQDKIAQINTQLTKLNS